jgi:hypothetical protein
LPGRRNVAAGELDFEAMRQTEQAAQKAIDPGFRQAFR